MKLFTLAALSCAGILSVFAAPGTIHLVQKPAMNKTEIVFSYSGDLWRVAAKAGCIAPHIRTRLRKRSSIFSGWQDPGIHRRVRRQRGCLHGARCAAACPSASRIIPMPTAWWAGRPTASEFCSAPTDSASRDTRNCSQCLRKAALPEALPLPMACMGTYSPDGKRMVYAPHRWRAVRQRLYQLSWRGGDIAAVRPATCGSSTSPTLTHDQDSAHRFQRHLSDVGRRQDRISSPIATAR